MTGSIMLKWQREANRILDEPDEAKQRDMWRSLPLSKEDKAAIGELIRKEKQARQDYRTYGWRAVWLRSKLDQS